MQIILIFDIKHLKLYRCSCLINRIADYLLIHKKISNTQLKEKAGFSANIITRLKRNEYVSTESIERICRVLKCGVDDILEFLPEEKKGKEV